MNIREATEKLQTMGQIHLLSHQNELSPIQLNKLLMQVEFLDPSIFHHQQQLLTQQSMQKDSAIEPFSDYVTTGNEQDRTSGNQLISEGAVGCILIAGGQATRLRFNGPKGLFPITPFTKKTLFQFFAEKVVAASNQVKRLLPLAIMTSPLNDEIIKQFFSSNEYFGLKKEQLFFFCQKMLPFLDVSGNLVMDSNSQIAEGPDGNGYSLKYFVDQGIYDTWAHSGVEFANYILIDNPLADPFDAELVGFHARNNNDATVKCVVRKNVDEKVGVLTSQNGKIQVKEYSELPEKERTALQPDGSLRYLCANISLFCFSMDFIKTASQIKLPFHIAYKSINSSDTKAWKFETFIFDLLPYASKVKALLYPRERCFAPLKNESGEDSVITVQNALQEEARRIIAQITSLQAPSHPFELAPEFYYPTQELLSRWHQRAVPSNASYIAP